MNLRILLLLPALLLLALSAGRLALAENGSCDTYESIYQCENVGRSYASQGLFMSGPATGGFTFLECSYLGQCTNVEAWQQIVGYCGHYAVYGCAGMQSCNCEDWGTEPGGTPALIAPIRRPGF